jgi:hypothetical protein
MRTTKSGYLFTYWPVALAAALLAMVALRAYSAGGAPHEPLAADQVTAELARTVSYGLINEGAVRATPAVRRAVAPAAAVVAAPGASAT